MRTDAPLPAEVFENLRAVDPLGDHELTRPPAGLWQDIVDGAYDKRIPLTPDRPPRRTTWAPLTAAALVVIIAIALTRWVGTDHHPAPETAVSDGVAQVTSIPAAYRTIARATNPLSADMTVDCLGVSVPVPMLAAPGGAERGLSGSSQALRHFLAHNPFAGMGSVTPTNWLLLSRGTDTLVFGQRNGQIGVGSVVVLTRHGAGYEATSEGGCGPAIPAPHESGEPVSVASHGRTLALRWENGSNCGTGAATTERTLARVLVRQTAAAVHVLLISKPSPDAGPIVGACAGVGIGSSTTVTLDAPLGNRRLVDDAPVPGHRVVLGR